jgi:hypothetical protein
MHDRPRKMMMMIISDFVESELAGGTKLVAENPAPVSLCLPQIPQVVIWVGAQADTVGS